MSQYTGKIIPYQEIPVFFRVCFFFQQHNGIAKKCSLASPCREVLEQSHACLVGTGGHRRLWINGIFGFLISGFGWSPRRLFKSARYINIGLLRSLRGQHGWCRWWGYIHEEQCGYRRFSAPYIKRRRKKNFWDGGGGDIDLNPCLPWPSLLPASQLLQLWASIPSSNLPTAFPQ